MKKQTLAELEKRIEALEKMLAAARQAETHIHHHYQQPAYQPVVPVSPAFPQPWRWPYEVTCTSESSPGAAFGLPQNTDVMGFPRY